MTRAAAYALVVALVVVRAGTGPAGAEDDRSIIDREQRFALTLAAGFVERGAGAGDANPLFGYEHGGWSAVLAVSRVDHPNAAAWRSNTREAYFDDIEAGVREHVSGYQMMGRKTSSLSTVPVLDLSFRHGEGRDGQVVLLRFLCFRQYTLALAVSVPERAYKRHRRALERVQQSFKPHLDG